MTNTLLSVVIREKNKVVFEGKIKSLSSSNDKGIFDILPMHTNFVSVINSKLELIKQDDSRLQIILDQKGIIKVKADMVEIYLGL